MVSVAVRMRPLTEREHSDEGMAVNGKLITMNEKNIRFDEIFDQNALNEDVYQRSCSSLVESVVAGISGVIMAYGQSGAGKTHTIFGSKREAGVVSLAVKALFEKARTTYRKFSVQISYLEVYNEKVIDLLHQDQNRPTVKVQEDKKKNVIIKGASKFLADSWVEAMAYIKRGNIARQSASTRQNLQSSRSHAILKFEVQSNMDKGDTTVSNLLFVDLAGSEKACDDTERRREGANINKSLLTLGNVIRKLSEGVKCFVPYRESVLTRILQNSLKKNRIVLIANITSARECSEETFSTLKFSSMAQLVQTAPTARSIPSNQSIATILEAEVKSLKRKLNEVQIELEEKNSQLGKVFGPPPAKRRRTCPGRLQEATAPAGGQESATRSKVVTTAMVHQDPTPGPSHTYSKIPLAVSHSMDVPSDPPLPPAAVPAMPEINIIALQAEVQRWKQQFFVAQRKVTQQAETIRNLEAQVKRQEVLVPVIPDTQQHNKVEKVAEEEGGNQGEGAAADQQMDMVTEEEEEGVGEPGKAEEAAGQQIDMVAEEEEEEGVGEPGQAEGAAADQQIDMVAEEEEEEGVGEPGQAERAAGQQIDMVAEEEEVVGEPDQVEGAADQPAEEEEEEGAGQQQAAAPHRVAAPIRRRRRKKRIRSNPACECASVSSP